jgi:eukaryotic-like serine/threonine-protein kinase
MKACSHCGKSYDDNFRVCPHDGTQLVQIAEGADPMLGRLLAERFLIVEKLGEGGMGSVYKAVHTQMDRICAFKTLLPSAESSESAAARFKREARMASRIDNPHAVTIYDFGQAEGGMLYLAMEFIDGKQLSDVLSAEWPLGLDRVVRITNQIAQALEAAHSLGIVHRDLKPDNIMLARKGDNTDYVKVLDFGIAKTVADSGSDNVTRTGFVLGTPIYMSPEQLAGEKVDARSDVYSLALIVYEMLSARLPFEGENTQAIMFKRVTSEPTPLRKVLPQMSEAVEQALMYGLARDPQARIQTAAGFASILSSAARMMTQGIGGAIDLFTGQPSDRATIPIAERGTLGDPSSGHREQPVIPHNQPPAPYPPPTSFATRPSSGPPPTPPTVGERTGPGVAGPGSTLSFESARPAPATRMGEQISRAPEPYSTAGMMPQTDLRSTPQAAKPGKAIIIVAALFLIGLIGLGGGYYLYSRLMAPQPAPTANPTPPPANPAPTTPPAKATTEADASAYYANGKKHQEQAYLLANSGSKSESVEESKKAIAEYRQAISIKPKFPEAHENLAVALYNAGQLEESLNEYRAAIAQYTELYQKPTDQVYTNYGLALFDLKRYGEAAEAFSRALEIDPKDYDLHAHRGFALQNAGDQAGAKAAYQKYLSLAPAGQFADFVRQILAGRAQPPTDSGNQ